MSSSVAAGAAAPATAGRSFIGRQFPTFAAWLGSMGGPVLRRELRAAFRRHRFFLLHFSSLSLLGLALSLFMTFKVEEESLDPTRVGQSLFSTFFLVQAAVVLLVFPAFGATALSEERGNQSLELLLVTTMRPVEIVWGKFLAASFYSLMYIVGSVPLLSIAYLFGRLQVAELCFGFGLLVAGTLFIALLGVAISSAARSNIAATLGTYIVVFLGSLLIFLFYLKNAGIELLPADGTVVGEVLDAMGRKSDALGLNLAILAAIVIVLGSYLFLLATNRLRPASSDRSSSLRLLTLLAVPGYLLLRAWAVVGEAGSRSIDERTEALRGIVLVAGFFVFAVALIFPTEEARVSRRAELRAARWRGLLAPLRLLAPGAFWGFAYVIVLAAVVSLGLLGLWAWSAADGAIRGDAERQIVQALTLLPLVASAFAAYGYFLASCDFTPRYARLTVLFTFIIAFLLPLIFYLRNTPDSLWTLYYLSPATLWVSLDTATPPSMDKVTFTLGGLHAVEMAKAMYAGLTLLFFAAGLALCHRARGRLRRHSPPAPSS
jgi:ABC-type transport system involved in multi-copper enzyme maturation permease subunit